MIQEQQPAVKTVIKVDIHKIGMENENITNAIATHNAGISRFTMKDLEGYAALRNAIYPSKNMALKSQWPVTHVSEDGGKTFTLSLTWNEVQESNPDTETAQAGNEIDDMTNIHFR